MTSLVLEFWDWKLCPSVKRVLVASQMFVGVRFNYAGTCISFGWIKVASAFICVFSFRILSQIFIYINPKVHSLAALLEFDDGLKITKATLS